MAEVYMAGDFRNGTTFEMDGKDFVFDSIATINQVRR